MGLNTVECANLLVDTFSEMIFEHGYGMFEYLEFVKFAEKLKGEIFGIQGNEGDKEFKEYVRSEISKFGGKYVSPRGASFELAETGTKYDFSQDKIWTEINSEIQFLEVQRKNRESLLKTLSKPIIETDPLTGETFTVYPAVKSSTSSFKITLSK